MRKLINILTLCGLVVAASSCNKFLDINNVNPNSPIASTPELVLPQALAATAASTVTYNSYGAWVGGYQANAGGYGGFGSVLTYNYATSDNNGLWTTAYDNLNDYQYIINNSTPTGPYKNFNAAARIMKAYVYQKLVDQYGDVPYSEATQGVTKLTPKYDKAEDIYKALFTELNAAIATMNAADNGQTVSLATSPNGKVDVLFGGTKATWVAFANTLKLRMLIRIQHPNNTAAPRSATASEVTASMATTYNTEKAALAGATFLTTDAIVQPGYAAQAGKQNPAWNSYAYTSTGGSSSLTTIPTTFAVGYYNGAKLSDAFRGPIVYKAYATNNQLGNTASSVPTAPAGGNWYTGTGTGTASNGVGILKGPTMGQPIMLAAESYFLQSEGVVVGLITGNAAALFNSGITASFAYLYKDQNGGYSYTSGSKSYTLAAAQTDATTYQTANAGSYLANFGTTYAQQIEAIITQKWIAVNYIHSDEGWNEYRRTAFPYSDPAGAAVNKIASTTSTSTRADKLPVRVLYPASEYALNASNAPAGISAFTSRIFWDAN